MPTIIVRGLDDAVKARLAELARQHGRSMEAEARHILTRAAQPPNIGLALLHAGQAVGGIDELEPPGRDDEARVADLE